MRDVALFLMCVLVGTACKKPREAKEETRGAAATKVDLSPAPERKPAESTPERTDTLGAGVSIVSAMVFHPFAQSRVLPSVRDDQTFESGGYDMGGKLGVGLVVEVENKSDELLTGVTLQGGVTFSGTRGTVHCSLEAARIGYDGPRFVSHIPARHLTSGDVKAQWKAEDSELEGVWRPKERIRMFARNDRCESLLLLDTDPQKVSGSVRIVASRRFGTRSQDEFQTRDHELTLDGYALRITDRKTHKLSVVPASWVTDMESLGGAELSRVKLSRQIYVGDASTVSSEATTFEIPARALTLQKVKLPSGELGYASGNIVVHDKAGAPVFDDMAKLGLSLHSVDSSPLDKTPPEVSLDAPDLKLKSTDFRLSTYLDDVALEKGKRRLTARFHVEVAGAAIEGRYSDKLGTAEGTRLVKAERSRVQKQIACDGISLVTNKTVRTASNKGAAQKTCANLDVMNSADFSLEYDLERHEVPVALSWSVGKDKRFFAIASEAFTKPDPR